MLIFRCSMFVTKVERNALIYPMFVNATELLIETCFWIRWYLQHLEILEISVRMQCIVVQLRSTGHSWQAPIWIRLHYSYRCRGRRADSVAINRWLNADCSNSIANALELLQSCTKPLKSIRNILLRILWVPDIIQRVSGVTVVTQTRI